MTLEQLLEAMNATANPAPIAVDLPCWGKVYVRARTVAEVDLDAARPKAEGGEAGSPDSLARAVAAILCDQEGRRLLDPDNTEHLRLLGAQPYIILERALRAAAAPFEGGEAKK